MKKLLLFLLAFTGSITLNASDRSNNTTPTPTNFTTSVAVSSGYQSVADQLAAYCDSDQEDDTPDRDYVFVEKTEKPARPHDNASALRDDRTGNGANGLEAASEGRGTFAYVVCVVENPDGTIRRFNPATDDVKDMKEQELNLAQHPWEKERLVHTIANPAELKEDLKGLEAPFDHNTFYTTALRTVAPQVAAVASSESLQHATQAVTTATTTALTESARLLTQGAQGFRLGINDFVGHMQRRATAAVAVQERMDQNNASNSDVD